MTDQYNLAVKLETKKIDVSDSLQNIENSALGCLDTAEEVNTTDSSENYVKGSYRCEKFDYSDTTNMTISSRSINNTRETNPNLSDIYNNIQIPIVGYEVMEERARFTVYKLRIENKTTGDCWYVFRRYTDFVRLCSKLKIAYPQLTLLMPRKKWFGNNFDPNFLEERIQGLQAFVNAIISISELLNTQQIQDFFCLNEPPAYADSTEESRAIFEALEDTIYHLRHQLKEKETSIEHLHTRINDMSSELKNLKKFIQSSTENCQKCNKEYDNHKKVCEISSLKSGSSRS